MKRIAITVLLAAALAACGEKNVDTYTGREGVYFNKRLRVGNILSDRSEFTFVYQEPGAQTYDIAVPVQLVGRTSDIPRPVDIRIVGGDAVEGVDFTAPSEAVLPAGASSFEYIVTIHRTPVLQTEARTIELEIFPNEYFEPVITREMVDAQSGKTVTALGHTVEFSELFIEAPAAWYVSMYSFSPARFFLTCEVMDVPREDFNDRTKVSTSRFQYLIQEMIKYVDEQLRSGDPDPAIFDPETGQPLF